MSDGNLFDDTNTRSCFIYGEGMIVWSGEIVPFCTMVYGWWKTGRMRTCLFNVRLRGWFLRQDLRVYRCVFCRKVAILRVKCNNVTGKRKSCGRWKNNIYFVIGHSCDSLIIMCYVL